MSATGQRPLGERAPVPAGRRIAAVRITTVLDAAPLVLVVVAEAAWISVIAGLLQEYALRDPVLGIPSLVGFVVAGIAAARWLGRRLGSLWPPVALGLTIAGGIIGWLASPEARAALAGNDLAGAVAAHPAGWLASVAVFRGFAHAHLPLAETTVARLLGLGIPGLAFAALAGGAIADPWRGRFLSDALVASIIFAAGATLGLAFARLSAVGWNAGFNWRRNPSWAGLVVVLVIIAVGIAMPVAMVVPTLLQIVLGVSLGPVLVGGLILGLEGTWRRVLGLSLVATMGVYLLVTIFARSGGILPVIPISVGPGDSPDPADEVVTVGLGGLALFAAVVAVLILARLWMRRIDAPEEDDVAESRWIDPGEPLAEPRRRWGRHRRPAPVDAAGAYVALIDDLASRPIVRRAPAETPAEHARRLRHAGQAGLSLELLAADYALVRFAGVGLSEREDRRAVGRWRSLRRWLGRDTGLPRPPSSS